MPRSRLVASLLAKAPRSAGCRDHAYLPSTVQPAAPAGRTRRPGRVVGHAVAFLNPIHGQGITMGALGATFVDQVLGTSGVNLDSVPQKSNVS